MSNHDIQIDSPAYNDDDILCHCMSIKRSDISPLIKRNRDDFSLNELIDFSGAGSVCMGCHLLLEEMMGKTVWIPVKISSIKKTSNDAKIYRFESLGKVFHPSKAGQHIVLQAYVNGVWETRRYTLTTAAEETAYREIIIQREPSGKVSSWFHRVLESESNIRISQPAGDVTPDLVAAKPLICLVAGIGVTPVISFVRTINKRSKNSRQIIIDHSVLNRERLVLKDELDQLSNDNKKIHINYRITDSAGFIDQVEMNELIVAYPDCEFYVCGPPNYSDAVIGYLEEGGINQGSIYIEHFSSPETKRINQSKTYFYLGLVFFFAFLIQELFQLKMPWLESLQSQETYKIYSGLFLVIYMMTQFIMPYNKSCERPHASADTYKQHKFRGAFAPLVFFIHSTQFGVAYLLLLSIVYFSNFLLGLFNHERIESPIKRIRYFKVWLPSHIILSVLTVALIGFHIYVVASY